MEDNKLIIYKNSEGNIIVDAIYKDETLWLSQKGMSKVFDVGVPAISKQLELAKEWHIKKLLIYLSRRQLIIVQNQKKPILSLNLIMLKIR